MKAVRGPNAYQIEKLNQMAAANRAEIEAIKALRADGKSVNARRLIKLKRAVKLQALQERLVGKQVRKYADGQVPGGAE